MHQKGDKVDWMRQPRGGYGSFYPVAGVVIGQTPKRVKIAVMNLTTKQVEYKSVKPASLLTRYNPLKVDELLQQATA